MGSSSLSRSFSFITIDNPYDLRRPNLSVFVVSSNPFLNLHISRHRKVRLCVTVSERKLEASWLPPEGNADGDYGGWEIVDTLVEKKKGFPKFVLASGGILIAFLLAVHFSLERKGLKFQFSNQFHALRGMLMPSNTVVHQSRTTDFITSDVGDVVSAVENTESKDIETSEIPATESMDKIERVLFPISVDYTQQEAVQVLKKLKIMEDDVKADELCTRREYARWLVKANSLLERNRKDRITPSMLLAGSVVCAFDDVNVVDPDFLSIQALAEAGIISSKLSVNACSFYDDDLKVQGRVFFPDSFVTRLDLINWKAQLEYSFVPGIEEKISRMKVDYMDVRGISPDAFPELFMDMLTGDKSILRKVFGKTKRLQPSKPVTKAQVAVALTSGRMTEAMYAELSRLEAESLSRKAEMEEIRSELLSRGEIQKFWEENLCKEKAFGLEVEKGFLEAVHDLEQEKIVRDKGLTEVLKEKSALDCQKQLLYNLKEEVNQMSERFASEKADFMVEQGTTHDMLTDLQAKQEAMLDAKSILEAEKEALQILRSWIEDEARKSQARSKVLEEVLRRWKWKNED